MFPLFTTGCLHVRHDVRDPSGGSGNCGRNFAEMTTSTPFRDLLHATNLRHGTDSFTSPPKEGVLRIFSPLKIRRLSAGFEPANLGTKGQHATPRPPKLKVIRNKKISHLKYKIEVLLFEERSTGTLEIAATLTGISRPHQQRIRTSEKKHYFFHMPVNLKTVGRLNCSTYTGRRK